MTHHRIRKLACLILAGGLSTPALADESGFTMRFPIDTAGKSGSLYAVVLPGDVYAALQRPDLGDITIVDRSGTPVPFAIQEKPEDETTPVTAWHDVPWFPLPAASAGRPQPLGVAVQQDGSLVAAPSAADLPHGSGIVADLSALASSRKRAVRLTIEDKTYQGAILIEGSDDLNDWSHYGRFQLTRLTGATGTLENATFLFADSAPRYLRLTPDNGTPQISGVSVQTENIPPPAEGPLQFKTLIAAPDQEGHYDFDLTGHYPVTVLRFILPQINTVTPASIYTSDSSPLDSEKIWDVAGTAILRHVQANDLPQPVAVSLRTSRFWRVTADPGSAGFGKGNMTVGFGWKPQTAFFLPRGEEPFSLLAGRAGDAVPHMQYTDLAASGMKAAPVSLGAGIALQTQTQAGAHWRGAILWGTLGAAIFVLMLMAWRLLRQSDTQRP